MRIISKRRRTCLMLAVLAVPVGGLSAQQQARDPSIIVDGTAAPQAAVLTPGPEIKGVISARNGDKMKVTTADGTSTIIAINDATRIKAASGLFGANRNKLS